ncbi:MAG: SCO family protein [Gammaproteobacteria bacterium]
MSRSRRHRPLAILFVVTILPVLAGGLLYLNPGLLPRTRVHHGELFDPVRSLAAMRLTRIGKGPFGPEELRGKWNLVWVTAAPCEIACRKRLDRMLQIHLALGKDLLRLQRLVIFLDRTRAPQFAAAINAYRDTIALAPADGRSGAFLAATFEVQNRSAGLFIVDPQSNIILRYENGADPEGVLKDLKRLLKYSWIG